MIASPEAGGAGIGVFAPLQTGMSGLPGCDLGLLERGKAQSYRRYSAGMPFKPEYSHRRAIHRQVAAVLADAC